MNRALSRPPRLPNVREAAAATAAALALAAVLALFVSVADLLADRHAGLIDHTVLGEAVEHRSLPMTVFMEAVSTAAEIPLMAAAGLLALFFARTTRSWRPLLIVGGAAVLSVGLATLVKDVVARTRPPLASAVVAETGFSFPSRHTTVATALLLAMAYLLARRTSRRALTAVWWATALALAALVAASRVYLGVHWATDVTAGFALGGAAALTLITADLGHRLLTRRRHGAS
ncbi:phosphatase PAP2 family protein [Streptomyces kaniharaensis]|uniref:Phosphatase PAP2 family protein n=1 Tax=Streptomyces kaniharaensis TaxID=212423 RepID=A0A6N7L0L7_9ACTN|nr:phosphatase PAP2 family protein [Streptomyces kaniharaensis]MQS17392.1 phosphatase PAP2 family protein [Streptomyces kaniharaensis]